VHEAVRERRRGSGAGARVRGDGGVRERRRWPLIYEGGSGLGTAWALGRGGGAVRPWLQAGPLAGRLLCSGPCRAGPRAWGKAQARPAPSGRASPGPIASVPGRARVGLKKRASCCAIVPRAAWTNIRRPQDHHLGRVRLAGWLAAGWPATSQNHCSRPARIVFFSHNNQLEQYFSVLPNMPYVDRSLASIGVLGRSVACSFLFVPGSTGEENLASQLVITN